MIFNGTAAIPQKTKGQELEQDLTLNDFHQWAKPRAKSISHWM